jgi:hypothetical protein
MAVAESAPPLNSLVRLRDGGGSVHETRIEDVEADGILIAAPMTSFDVATPEPNAGYLLTWYRPRGVHELPVRVVEVRDGRVPMWLVQPDGPVHLIQRRAHVRAPTLLAAIVIPPRQEALPALVTNLSEGGLRCSLAADLRPPVGPGVEVIVSFKLQDTLLRLPTTVVRIEDAANERVAFGARIRPTEPEAALIRRHVLDWQRQVLAKGLSL